MLQSTSNYARPKRYWAAVGGGRAATGEVVLLQHRAQEGDLSRVAVRVTLAHRVTVNNQVYVNDMKPLRLRSTMSPAL